MPNADDLLFLLRLISDSDGLPVADEWGVRKRSASRGRRAGDGGRDDPSSSSSWRRTLAALPGRRRDIVTSCGSLVKAISTLRDEVDSRRKMRRGRGKDGGGMGGKMRPTVRDGRWGNEYDNDEYDGRGEEKEEEEAIFAALMGVERAATTFREHAREYLESSSGEGGGHRAMINALRRFWCRRTVAAHATPLPSELDRIGRILASQLIDQIVFDSKLVNAISSFLDDELYRHAGMYDDDNDNFHFDSTTASVEKLRVWGDAMSRMTRIDKSLWDFVRREIHDEAIARESERERWREEEVEEDVEVYVDAIGELVGYGGEVAPEFFNGEPSTRILTSNYSIVVQNSCKHDDFDERVVDDDEGLRELILASASVEEAVEKFARWNASSSNCLRGKNIRPSLIMTSVLLVGDEGSGKTHTLDSIQRRYSSSSSLSSDSDYRSSTGVEILRPDRVKDMMGNSIGSTEDRIVALFACAMDRARRGRKCLVVLDDVDRIFSLSNDVDVDSADAQYHVSRRCKALFATILDAVRGLRFSSFATPGADEGHLLLLCTARSPCSEVADRFDRVLKMGRPDDVRRRAMILSCLSPERADRGDDIAVGHDAIGDETNDVIESMVSLVARHSVGKSACELAQCCREVMLRCAGLASPGTKVSDSDLLQRRLHCLDEILQTKTPLSLRVGSLDGVVDVRVFTPDELQSQLTTDKNGDVIMPLLGKDAELAYSALMNVVFTPLCRSDEIKALLYGGGGPECDDRGVTNVRPIRVGALLTGAPGVGKTSLAYHCAAVAAKMARVSLLDVSATSLVHKELGGSERAVRNLFAAVRAAAPCVLLIDGIESVASIRGNDTTTEGTMDRVLSTFLTEMDGIEYGGEDGASSSYGGNVAVIGITHRPDMIDPALLRPGRLEKTITLGAPEYGARREIIARQIEDATFDFSSAGYFDPKNKDEISSYLANETAGMSAMEVIAICREASMVCLRELNFKTITKPSLTYNHFLIAITELKGKAGF
ncbi:hypothetical protein ACHAXA_011662 [Cyclostephanos tholiformis]|uniref:AAA+ ATPase domain-containing protein n=1 Tax=Cyclostephanos tholiformis TaxID=382380 RepID=A0ABD3SEI3_9STRA